MAFVDELKARYPEKVIILLTNFDSKTATTINTTVVDANFADAKAYLRLHTGLIYDETDNRMLALMCRLVFFFLQNNSSERGRFQNEINDVIKEFQQITISNNKNYPIPRITALKPEEANSRNRSFSNYGKIFGFPTPPTNRE